MDRARSTHDNHAKCGHPTAEDIFAGVRFGQFLECTNHGADVRRPRTKLPIADRGDLHASVAAHNRGRSPAHARFSNAARADRSSGLGFQ